MHENIPSKQQVIVSLTSFPEAIPYAVQAIQSILDGSILPDKIVLYLDTQKFPGGKLPEKLEILKEVCPFFEVRFDPSEIRSYKKLIPAIKDFPEDIIVTIDDDIHYHKGLLKELMDNHKRIPDVIFAHRVRRIRLGEPYRKWKKYKNIDFWFKKYHFNHLAMQTGVGGVLYPPHSLDETMLNPDLFMKLAPTTDDVWFWAAAASRGTFVVPIPFGQNRVSEIGKPTKLSLKNININSGVDRNRQALETILKHYPSILKKATSQQPHFI